MRLIDADALEKLLNERIRTLVDENGWYDHYTSGFDDALTYVEDAPTIDAVPVVHARWIEIRGEMWNELLGQKCSNCGRRVRNCGENYCPKCGAKMDGGTEG